MTDEAKRVTDDWVARLGAQFAYGYDTKGELKRWLGIGGIPAAVLVDPSGKIVWKGHPNALKASVLDEAVKGALKRPVHDWPESASKAVKALRKREFAKALAEAEDIEGDERTWIADAIRQLAGGKRACVEQWMETGDYLAVDEQGRRYADQLEGLPEGATVRKLIERLEQDPRAQEVLEGQRKVARLAERKVKKSTIDRLRRELQDIVRELPDTAAARDAKVLLGRLK